VAGPWLLSSTRGKRVFSCLISCWADCGEDDAVRAWRPELRRRVQGSQHRRPPPFPGERRAGTPRQLLLSISFSPLPKSLSYPLPRTLAAASFLQISGDSDRVLRYQLAGRARLDPLYRWTMGSMGGCHSVSRAEAASPFCVAGSSSGLHPFRLCTTSSLRPLVRVCLRRHRHVLREGLSQSLSLFHLGISAIDQVLILGPSMLLAPTTS
jgi:hypothetical protein